MKTALTVDSAGRIVLPSEARRLLNLRPGSRLRLTIVAERIELTPEPQTEQAPSTSPTGRPLTDSTTSPGWSPVCAR